MRYFIYAVTTLLFPLAQPFLAALMAGTVNNMDTRT